MRTLRLALMVLVAVVAFGGMALAAAPVMLHPDPSITVDVPKFGLVIPNNLTWALTMTSNDTAPDDGILFTASEASGTYILRVFSNTDVTVSLGGGDITSGTTTFHPTYTFTSSETLSDDTHVGGDNTTLYISGAAKNDVHIDLSAFSVLVGAAPNAGTNITEFVPGNATGTLQVTVAATV